MSAAAGAAGLAPGRAAAAAIGRRRRGGRRRRRLRRTPLVPAVLRHRATYNVVAEAGDRDAERTIVFVAHHDAAHGGLCSPRSSHGARGRLPGLVRAPGDLAAGDGPRRRRAGAGGARRGARAGGCAGSAPSCRWVGGPFADIGSRSVVPGANDNLSGVAVLVELARALRERPVQGVRVLLAPRARRSRSWRACAGCPPSLRLAPTGDHRGRLPRLGRLTRADHDRGRGHDPDARLHPALRDHLANTGARRASACGAGCASAWPPTA